MENKGKKIERSVFVGKNIEKSNISTGDGSNITSMYQSDEVSKAAIQESLQALLNALEAAPIDEDVREIVNSDIHEVAKQLEKPDPQKAIILPKVKAIMETITATAAASQAWPSIVQMAESLFESVRKLFGG